MNKQVTLKARPIRNVRCQNYDGPVEFEMTFRVRMPKSKLQRERLARIIKYAFGKDKPINLIIRRND